LLFRISCAKAALHQKNRKNTAQAASRLHGGGSLRRLLFKQTEPLNHKTREPHTARLHS